MTPPELWSNRQRRVVLAIVVALLIFLAIEYRRQPVEVPDPFTGPGARSGELSDRMDPNTADEAMLAALPMLGEKRAAEIVAYREDFLTSHPGHLAFNQPRDLLKLKNFGVATLGNVEKYLIFPSSPAATQIIP